MNGYENLVIHQAMLKDRVRTVAYENALRTIVRRGDHVIDFGCGTGILSFFAARCGAAQIYAVDSSKLIRAAQRIARHNGFTNVSFYYGDGETIELPDKADVIVSEWMGHFVYHEWMLKPLVRLRDTYLREGGTMIPRRIVMKLGFIVDKHFFDDYRFFESLPYGIDFSPVREWPFYSVNITAVPPAALLPETATVDILDMHQCTDAPPSMKGSARIAVETEIHGLCGWFEADLCDNVTLRTGPFDPPTHWRQMVFPLSTPLRVRAGDEIHAVVSASRAATNSPTLWQWSLSNGSETVAMDSFIHYLWLSKELPKGRLA